MIEILLLIAAGLVLSIVVWGLFYLFVRRFDK